AYLGDGIADTVLHVLSQVDGLTVTARTSSFAFRDRDMTVSEIAQQLGVAHILEGSVQRAGDQLRIITRLIEARRGRELWSGNFDRGVEEIFAIQDEIAREVVASMGVVVLADDRERLENEYHPDLKAYELYVLARRDMDRGTADSVARAVERLERAIEIDPEYALAYTALSTALFHHTRANRAMSIPEQVKRRAELAEKALELDPTLAEAWNEMSAVYAERKEWDKASEAIQKALELNPNSAEAWAGYWNMLLLKGDREEGLRAIRKAVELDPESIRYQTSLAQQLFELSRAEEAIYVLRESVERHPDAPQVYVALARYLNQVGEPGEAMWYLQAIHRRDPENLMIFNLVCQQYWQLWDIPSAIDCLERQIAVDANNLDARKWLAWLKGEDEEAARLARIEVEQRPTHWYPKMQLADGLSRLGEWDEIIETVTSAFPELMGADPQINDWNQWGARKLIEALIKTGQTEQANMLVEATLTHFERSRRLQAGGFMAGPEDALVYSLVGEYDQALESLEKAIVRDWTFFSLAVVEDSAFNALREDARFVELVDRLAQKMAEERAWYEAHKDDLVL
ncbi:MAG: tetratricopeptide repeat protein, partial [Xanthomonadales bacterium]|nr:tetratricopeptide repeat protein [Xanthomonadales bacterium]